MENQQTNEILLQLDQMQKQLDAIRDILMNKNLTQRETLIEPEYSTQMSWKEKIFFILRHYGRPVLSSEMISFLDYHDTILQYKRNEVEKLKMLSTQLNRLYTKGLVERVKKPGQRGYFYTLI